jgi:UDP-N-acetylmuramyl tripeptide synthase
MILSAKVLTARAVGALARRLGRGGGTSLPGKVLMRLAPGAIGELGSRLRRGSVIISATNGKTTSAAMAASVLERGGAKLVHNRAGANMAGGIASTLLDAAGRGSTIAGDLGLFEVDEFWLDQLARELDPRVLLLSNLFRDQLDRYGELETIADRWEQVVATRTGRSKFVLNADDPLVADLGRERPGVVYFGVEDTSMALPGLQHASDSKHCRRCGAPYVYDAAFMGHLGHYHCPNCGRRRPEPDVAAEKVVLHGTRSASVRLRTPGGTRDVELPLPGLYNVYNALGAAALCFALDVPLDDVVAGLQTVAAAFGRAETLQVGGRAMSILLVKNPAGANEVLRTLALEDADLDLFAILNDNTADGHDISWIWDADFEVIAERARRITCSGVRAHELALRLKYAGVPRERLHVVPDPSAGLDAALADGSGPLFALPTYTALLGLRDELADRGAAARFWEPAA